MVIDDKYVGLRLDKALTQIYPDRTRNYFQNLLDEGFVKINGAKVRASYKVQPGDTLDVHFPALKELAIKAKNIPLDILYEDKNVLVINKPAGLVVHPGIHGSHSEDSLVNAILHHCKGDLGGIGGVLRPGIVHRLDKDTSGVLVVAKNDKAQQFLMEQFSERKVTKVYYALVAGHLEPKKGTIDAPIGRSTQDRKKMAVIERKDSKDAVTKYEVVKYLEDFTYVRVYLLTGRTHQIRVHFAAIGFPIVGDPTYGRLKVNSQFQKNHGLKRQFLHAAELTFVLPGTTKKEEFVAALPDDLQIVLDSLALTSRSHSR